ncbi:MAG: S-methyl-5-thioribose-1-phosphate isomerase [Planctomycetes bacterium]|nr:S-methyl-5-thioribose-1-phosphate isomerase [Planctomycetota bacterium]
MKEPLRALEWVGGADGHLRLLDQTRLPGCVEAIECRDVDSLWDAIRMLRVRGAPAIGVAASYGLVLGLARAVHLEPDAFLERMRELSSRLRACRPTGVNLFACLDRLEAAARQQSGSARRKHAALLDAARALEAENAAACEAMARYGAERILDGWGVLTHCNTGPLATAGAGTALGVLVHAHRQGKRIRVYACETRPLLQGARITTLELRNAGLDVVLLCDSAAAQVMAEGRVQAAVVGADRIAANGDVANKIGTLGLAVNAAARGIPFYVVAPIATIDPALPSGSAIPIEERDPGEVTELCGGRIAPADVPVYNPAFDVTPHGHVTAIVTEAGVLEPPYGAAIRRALQSRTAN